jgi:hypothetical protein
VAAWANCTSTGAEELVTSPAAYEAAVKVANEARIRTWRRRRREFVGIIIGVSLSSAIEFSMQGSVRSQSVSTRDRVRLNLKPEWEVIKGPHRFATTETNRVP